MDFGKRLRELIDNKGITPYQISQETGISQATLSRLLGSLTAKPSIKNIRLLANYFNISQTWLLTGDGEKQKSTKHPLAQMTDDEVKVAMAVELARLYEQGKLYPAAVHDKIVAKLESRIEELVRENNELRRKSDELAK